MILLDPADLTLRLAAVDSTSGREGEVVTLLDRILTERGWNTRRIPVSPGRDDLLATTGTTPVVTLSTHLDTVPPFIAPSRDDGVIRGRGTCDAKGIAASMICAAERLRDGGIAVALLFVVGEEVAHDGARAANDWAAEHGIRCRVLINGEPTESTLALGTKGALRVVVRTEGREAHSAYPHLGRSATHALVHLLAELDDVALPADEVLGDTTINIGALSGGLADNVVAPWAEARLMARLVTPVEDVREILDRWAGSRALLEYGVTVPAMKLGRIDGFRTSIAAFATDIPELGNWGTPYLFGPGSIHVAHRPDEHVRVDELRAAVDAYERLAMAALKA